MSNLTQPVIAVGAVVFRDDCVLLVKRKHPPHQGQWAVPGGKVRLGETLAAAAEREIFEETGITIRALNPVHTFEVIEKMQNEDVAYHYVVIDLLGEYLAGDPVAADDVTDAAWIDRKTFSTLQLNRQTSTLLHQQFRFPE